MARLRSEVDPLIAEWERRVREALPAAQALDSLALQDSMPQIIERVAETIASGAKKADAHFHQLAAEHARERAESGDYSLEHVLGEYHLLEQVLLDGLERDGEPLDRELRDTVRKVIHVCVAGAAVEFTNARTHDLTHDSTLYQHLVEVVRDYAIFSVDPDGVVMTWNKGAERMKLYRPDEIIGTHFSVFYTEDARQRREAVEHLHMASERGRYRGEGWRVRKGGEIFLADVLITPMYVGGRLQGYSKVVADLTERSKIVQERELSIARVADIQAEQSAREDFITKLSHDLRSPLQAAKMGADLVRRRLADPAAVDRLMERISANLTRVDEMIQELLDLNRLRAGETPTIQRVRCDLSTVVRDTLDELATIHGDRFVLVAQADIEGEWDPDAIRRIVENLCSNAAKHGSRTEQITITLVKTSHEAQISVHNHGEVIPPDERVRLFEQFARVSGRTRSSTTGWGIGLAVVKALAEAHGGTVRVDSAEGIGTTFKIDLPLRATPPADPTATRPPRTP
ncbi:MAG: PAS domain-containing sensor histidine kinase [Myxococcota bacterium]|nr:PAS domain-containing sensor histidine kinase [Myxococcota bacterium]